MTRQAYISDEAVVRRANAAVRIELEKKRAMERGQRSVNGSGRGVTVSVLRKKSEIKTYLKCSDLEAAQLAEKQR